MTAEIKECPFCGSTAERSDCIGCGYIQIRCPECGANISIVLRNQESYEGDEAELIRRWNNRVETCGKTVSTSEHK